MTKDGAKHRMTSFVNNDVASGAIVKASDHNTQGALLASVINGNIDSTNLVDKGVTLAKVNGGSTAGNLKTDASGNVTSAKVGSSDIDFTTLQKFRAYRNAAANTGSGSMATVVFDTKSFDIGTVFNTSTGTFTAPVAGYYDVKWRLKWVTSGAEQIQSILVKNGSTTVTSGDNTTTPGTAHATTKGADTIQLASGDTLIVQCSSSTAARALEVGSANCYFAVSLVAV